MTMAEEGGYLGAMTYQCLFKGAIERVMQSHKADEVAYHALNVTFNFFEYRTSFI